MTQRRRHEPMWVAAFMQDGDPCCVGEFDTHDEARRWASNNSDGAVLPALSGFSKGR